MLRVSDAAVIVFAFEDVFWPVQVTVTCQGPLNVLQYIPRLFALANEVEQRFLLNDSLL